MENLMLKNFLKKNKPEVSPMTFSTKNSNDFNADTANGNIATNAGYQKSTMDLDDVDVETFVAILMGSPQFMQKIEELVTSRVLDILLQKYDFEPTDKYKQEIENKKKYINQLDAYLNERKEINKTVESDLQRFLSETTGNLTKALESFSMNIHNQIKGAENRYGIDTIKNTLLNNNPDREALVNNNTPNINNANANRVDAYTGNDAR